MSIIYFKYDVSFEYYEYGAAMIASANRARERLKTALSDHLRQAFGSVSTKKRAVPRDGGLAFDAIGKELLLMLLQDKKTRRDLLTILNDGEPKPKEWLTTEEAGARMGFSRPYVTALFDSGEFAGGVSKSTGGHRRVRASAVDAWMSDHGVSHPLSKTHQALLDQPNPPEFFAALPKITAVETKRLREQIATDRDASLTHRPKTRK